MNLYVLLVVLATLFIQASAYSRSNFKSCCAKGRESSDHSCKVFTHLTDTSSGCKYAFTLCCNQIKRSSECERGKKHAYAGHSCYQLSRNSYDSLTDCCSCCELGIQARKNGEQCEATADLSSECNNVFVDCCRRTERQPMYQENENDCSNSHQCSNGQSCENTFSGPVCRCPVGYEKDHYSSQCIDIDECKRPNVCAPGSTCQNTVGSYTCTQTCGVGYTSEDNQCKDVNECLKRTHNCAGGMRCENYPGSFRCIREKPCGTGYSVNVFTQECEDIDECSLNLHECSRGFTCLNVHGAFRCKPKECGSGFVFNYNIGECEKMRCARGFELNIRSGQCEDVDECGRFKITPCHSNQRCQNTPGSYRCGLILICSQGYELNPERTECVDIDECASGRHTCPSMATCVNTPRSYKCICPSGYKLDEHRNICDDIDECAFGKVCPSNSVCRNTPGSFACDCNPGFKLISHIFHSCADIDECQREGVCDHDCINTFGSYQCSCREGYRLASDGRTCEDINECEIQPNICPGICTNTPGSYECSCAAGFQLEATLRRACEDIDECALGLSNCQSNEVCVNTRGSFKCVRIQCPTGYHLRISEHRVVNRCDRTPTVCRSFENDCLRQPVKIFYSYTTITPQMQVPFKIFTTRVNTYSRRITLKPELRLSSAYGGSVMLREDQFAVKQTDSNTFEVYLLEPCSRNIRQFEVDLKIDFYTENHFTSCLMNKIHVDVADY